MRWICRADAVAIADAERAEIEERFAGCPMCAAVAPRSGRAILAENAAAIAMLDRFAARRGHVVVVLRRHVEAIADLPFEELFGVQRLAWGAARALTQVLAPRRVYVASLGAARRLPTSFPHHHVHVIPLFDGGDRDKPAEVFTWSRGVFVFEPGEAEALAAELRAAWPDQA